MVFVTTKRFVGFALDQLQALATATPENASPVTDWLDAQLPTHQVPKPEHLEFGQSGLPGQADTVVGYYRPDLGVQAICSTQAASAYTKAGEWGLRLGPPVGLTDKGELVFEPSGFSDGEHLSGLPATIGDKPNSPDVGRLDVYRPDGRGHWQHTATITAPEEMKNLSVPVRAQQPTLQFAPSPTLDTHV